MDFLDKLRNKSVREKKTIALVITIILGLILATLWIYSVYRSVERLKSENIIENLNIPNFKESLPKIEILE